LSDMFDIIKITVYSILVSVLIVPIYFTSATLYLLVNIFSVLLNTESLYNTFYEYRLAIKSSFVEYVEHITLIKQYY